MTARLAVAGTATGITNCGLNGNSAARLADTRALTDPAVKRLIQERGIILTTWKELMARRKQAGALE